MGEQFSRTRWLSRYFYTRHFLAELGPIAACIFTICGLLWAGMTAGWLGSCAATLFYAPWCH